MLGAAPGAPSDEGLIYSQWALIVPTDLWESWEGKSWIRGGYGEL